MAIPAVRRSGRDPPHPREPAGRHRPCSGLAAIAGGGYLVQDYVSQRLLPGLHMLDAAPGSSRQLPARRPVRRRGGRCGSRFSFPVRLPVRLPVPSAARRCPGRFPIPGAVPGSRGGSRCHPRRGILPVRPRESTAEPRRRPGPERPRAPRAGSMPRGRAWTQAEVSSLLSLVGGSGEAALLMASTSRPNEALWREISRGLAAAGYGRSVAQCRSKWKALKQAFHSERETRRRAGHHSPRLPPHYRAMKSIWKAAGRPVFGERRMPDVVKLPSRKRRSALATRSPSSSETPEQDVGGDTPCTLLSPMLQRAKDEPDTPGGDHITGVQPTPPAMPHADCCFPPLSLLGCHTDPKQEGFEGKAGSVTGFPGETSLGMGRGNQMLPLAVAATGSHETAATSEQPATAEDASDTSLHGSGVAGLLQNVQQLLVQILQTSRRQQALLESLASDTVSHLHLLSHSLVQVGETLHQLLLRPQIHPGPIGHYIPHMPLFEGGSGVPCSPGAPHTSLDHKEEPQLSPNARCITP
ncbi:uncharacterized protein LOC107215779 [Parus major]|uniref:uncharacterized protein LOC107215779 n=1 Tax=Parus major TaxID=9157 RepID=UPI000771006D|nr:uncharacterized protein LOC107215779 [Parus major]